MALTDLSNSPARAPNYNLVRQKVKAADDVANTPGARGLNAGDFEQLHLQIVPSAADNVAIDIYFWSPGASKWVKAETATFTAAGLGVAREITVQAFGRRVLAALSGTFGAGANDGVDVYASGF